jgi:hypothetical protein
MHEKFHFNCWLIALCVFWCLRLEHHAVCSVLTGQHIVRNYTYLKHKLHFIVPDAVNNLAKKATFTAKSTQLNSNQFKINSTTKLKSTIELNSTQFNSKSTQLYYPCVPSLTKKSSTVLFISRVS